MVCAPQVFDVGNETLVPEAQLNQYPSTEADIHVEVILRPKIDVYPASTTLVKSQVITMAVSTSNALASKAIVHSRPIIRNSQKKVTQKTLLIMRSLQYACFANSFPVFQLVRFQGYFCLVWASVVAQTVLGH